MKKISDFNLGVKFWGLSIKKKSYFIWIFSFILFICEIVDIVGANYWDSLMGD